MKVTYWGNLLCLEYEASPLMEQMVFFHDHTMTALLMITMFVFYIMLKLFFNKRINRFLIENQSIEMVWTVLPVFILVSIALPSLRLLYMMDEVDKPLFTVKVIGHQWYWTYEYGDFENTFEIESYMLQDLKESSFRLLDVDNRMVLPMKCELRVLVTSADVIHSWAVPSLAIKVDAIPGRLNQVTLYMSRPGLFFGQCSEVCGANHSFMPIVIESVNMPSFLKWSNNEVKNSINAQ